MTGCMCRSSKVKVKFTLEQAMKAQGGREIQLYSFLNLSARWEWVVNATPWLLYPQGERPSTHCIGGRVNPRAGLNRCWKSHSTEI
jgi:hypothetical protein